MLNIAEQILLISLDDATGEVAPLPMGVLDAVLAGALLMDLVFAAGLKLSSQGLKLELASPLEDPLLSEVLGILKEDGLDVYPIDGAIRKLASPHWEWSRKLAERLVDRHILEAHEERQLWFFKIKLYPMIEGGEERTCREHTRELLLGEKTVSEPRDLILISLLARSGLLDQILNQAERVQSQAKIEAILQQNQSLDDAIQAIIVDIQALFARLILP
jgi:hypothetical protein